MNIGDEIIGTIESLAFGGKGILKADKLVIFIPFTAPGDVVKCRLTCIKKNYAEAEIVDLLKAGPGRTLPRCPHYKTCGGCQLQHLYTETQLHYKQSAVIDALSRIGKIKFPSPPTITPATTIWGYRRHATLSLRPTEDGYTFGYTASDGISFVPIKECPIFLDKDARLFAELPKALKQFNSMHLGAGRLTILKTENNKFMLYLQFEKPSLELQNMVERIISSSNQWEGITVATPKQTLSAGAETTTIHIEGLSCSFAPGAFIQNHPEQSLNIYRDIVQLAECTQKPRVLDLYCGIGISSLLLARAGAKTLGVEGNPKAIAMAKHNAKVNGISNIDFIVSDVKKGLRKWLKNFGPNLVIVNPPRAGLQKSVIQELKLNPPKRLFYISCMPSTLARDIQFLCEEKFSVKSCRLYDMFPQTAHVETLIELHA